MTGRGIEPPQFFKVADQGLGAVIKLVDRHIGLAVAINTVDLHPVRKPLQIGVMGQMTIGAENVVEDRPTFAQALFDIGKILLKQIAVEDVVVPIVVLQIGLPLSGKDGGKVDFLESPGICRPSPN